MIKKTELKKSSVPKCLYFNRYLVIPVTRCIHWILYLCFYWWCIGH